MFLLTSTGETYSKLFHSLSFDSQVFLPHFISPSHVASSASVSCICNGSNQLTALFLLKCADSYAHKYCDHFKVLKTLESELSDMLDQLP